MAQAPARPKVDLLTWKDSNLSFSGSTSMASAVRYLDSQGREFTQLFQVFPVLEQFYTHYEKHWNIQETVAVWFADNMHVPFIVCGMYLVFCFVGRALMKDRIPYDWKWGMAAWNLLLSVFSTIGALRTVPHLLWRLQSEGLQYTICNDAEQYYGAGAAGLWVALFIMSKIPELFDTVFIVMRKKKLIFLHWYHHVTVLLYCWHAYATRTSAGLWFVAMNYTVHAVMYFYYFLSTWFRPPWDFVITTMQISQMFIGVGVCVMVYQYHLAGVPCAVNEDNFKAAIVMYFSYFCLFVWFAVNRYCLRGKSSGKGKGAKPTKPAGKAE